MKLPYLAAALLGISCVSHTSAPVPVQLPPPHAGDSLQVAVRVDSERHEIIVDAGPFDVPAMSAMAMGHDDMMDHAGMAMGNEGMMMVQSPLLRFNWPVQGWLRGYRLGAVDAQGNALPSSLLHHVIGVNFDRRQLVYDALERPFAVGSETGQVMLPKSIGMPIPHGDRLGMWGAWHNETGHDLHNVYLRAVLYWTPSTKRPEPTPVLPFYVDVHYVYGGDNAFDLPPGHTVKSYEFTQPIDGGLLAVGGHLHDYGVSVSLQDAETGKVLVKLDATRQPDGRVTAVARKTFVWHPLELKAGHRYRVVGVYDNPQPDTIKRGAMAHIVGAFIPDHLSDWPAIDPTNADFQKDVAGIPPLGATGVLLGRTASAAMQHQHTTLSAAQTDTAMDQRPWTRP